MITGLCIGQIGIALEFAGAFWLVISAFICSRNLKGMDRTIDFLVMAQATKDEVQGQFSKQLTGFFLLGMGLLLQLLSTMI